MMDIVKAPQPLTGGDEPGPGETRERARRLRLVAAAFAIAAASGVVGFLIGRRYADAFFDEATRWPAEFAVAAACTWIAVAWAGRALIGGRLDEFERQTQQATWAAAAEAYFFAYPLWFLLWKGDILPEPMHAPIFVGFVAVMAVAACRRRFFG